MSFVSDRGRRRLPWAAPAVAVVGVAAVALLPRAFAASDHPTLPATTPAALIAAIDASGTHALSGTVQSTPDLGLPKLPGSDGGNQLTTLLTEPATWTIAVSGTDKQRVALLGTGKEQDVIHDGTQVWTWDSSTQTATHYLSAPDRTGGAEAPATEPTPGAVAQNVLSKAGPSTSVTVGPTTRVAGRPAYTLVVTPRSAASLVGQVVIDVDSATKIPTGVVVYPRGSQTAALREVFSTVSFATPADSTFRFTPPTGATVHTKTASAGTHAAPTTPAVKQPEAHTVGDDWATVVVVPAGASLSGGFNISSALSGSGSPAPGGQRSASSLFRQALNVGPDGSRELQTRLLSVLITKAGTLYAGAVPVSTLESAAAAGK